MTFDERLGAVIGAMAAFGILRRGTCDVGRATDPGSWLRAHGPWRRDLRVAKRLEDAVAFHDGIPYLVPEIVLLFKSKHRCPKDEHDLDQLLPLLTQDQRTWLRAVLTTADPDNTWLARFGDTQAWDV